MSFDNFKLNPFARCSGTRFTLSRDELLTLPEFVLLSLFPNGLLPDGHMNSFHEGDIYPVDVCSSESLAAKGLHKPCQPFLTYSSMIPHHSNTCSNSFATSLKLFPPVRHLRSPLTHLILLHLPNLFLDQHVICFKIAPASLSFAKISISTPSPPKPTLSKQR